jgi:hypothetical protein
MKKIHDVELFAKCREAESDWVRLEFLDNDFVGRRMQSIFDGRSGEEIVEELFPTEIMKYCW